MPPKNKKGTSKPYPVPRRSGRTVSIQQVEQNHGVTEHGSGLSPADSMNSHSSRADLDSSTSSKGKRQSKSNAKARSDTAGPSRSEFDELKELMLSISSRIDKFYLLMTMITLKMMYQCKLIRI